MTTQPERLTDEQLTDIENRATAATVCPEAAANGRTDGQHTWTGSSFTHTRCALCDYTRPRGERAEETALLVAELRRAQHQRRYLIDQLAKRDAETGRGERALREFLSGEPEQGDAAAALRRDGFAPDEIANMVGPNFEAQPTLLRWGLDDVMWGDDDSVIVMLSGPDGEPYWLELDQERAAVLRQNLAGPEAAREVVHACPPPGSGLTPCCGRTPFELLRTDRMSADPAAVTCHPAAPVS